MNPKRGQRGQQVSAFESSSHNVFCVCQPEKSLLLLLFFPSCELILAPVI